MAAKNLLRWSVLSGMCLILACAAIAAHAAPNEGKSVPHQKTAEQEAARAAVKLFDTGAPSPTPLAGEAIARQTGWIAVPEDKTDHRFSGAAVVANDRLAIVLRRGAAGAELYSQAAGRAVLRAVLKPVADGPVGKLMSLAIVENSPAGVVIDVTYESPQGKKCGLRYELAMGQPYVQTEPREGATALSVEAPCRFVVLPDFFADDMVIDAAEIPVDTAELPSENFLLQMLPSHDAILMTVASNRGQDSRIELSGPAGPSGQRRIERSETFYGPRGKVWVAVLQAANIWHARQVNKDQAGKVVPLDWSAPLPALWRVDWRLPSGLSSSWEMAMQRSSGEFTKPGWFGDPQKLPATRRRWATVYGWYVYPCWIDGSGRGHLQPLTRPERLGGPALIYPINRLRETPLTDFTVVDVVRATLGVGPCEYILDVEGQGATMKGRATCGTRDALKAIYAAKQQKQKRTEIEKILTEVVVFVKHIRSRIDQYTEFGRQTVAYLHEQKKAHPELAPLLDEMETCARAVEVAFTKRQHSIREPQYVVDLTEKFRQTMLDYEGDDAVAKGLEITQAIVVVGGNQDELVGECRAAVKVLRQRAGLLMATHPNVAPIAREVRDRTQKALRNASSYEAPRH